MNPKSLRIGAIAATTRDGSDRASRLGGFDYPQKLNGRKIIKAERLIEWRKDAKHTQRIFNTLVYLD
ncbi:MAG: hypothetical protein ACE5H0_15510 [Bacteroidota bacterium]